GCKAFAWPLVAILHEWGENVVPAIGLSPVRRVDEIQNEAPVAGGVRQGGRSALAVGDDRENLALLHDEVLGAFDLHVVAGILAEQHFVADLDVELVAVAALVVGAIADGDDLAALGLFLRRVGDDDAAGGLLLCLLQTLDHDAVMQGLQLHVWHLLWFVELRNYFRVPEWQSRCQCESANT